MSPNKNLTVGVDPDPNGLHAYAIIETESKKLVDVLQLDWKQWLVGGGDRIEAVVIEWPGMGQSFACPAQKLPDGTKRHPINDTIRMAVLLAYELYNRNVPVYIPYRQRLLASAGRKVSDKGNTDRWVKQLVADWYNVPKTDKGNYIWKGTGLGTSHAQAAVLCARFPWWDFPNLKYQGSWR